MDIQSYLEQGQQLLEKRDAKSIVNALKHFKTANEMAEDDNAIKPLTIYFLALGNLHIGQIEQSYRIVYKAKRSLDTAMRVVSSRFLMDNMRQFIGGDNIDALIKHIEENYSVFVLSTNTEIDDFDENELDFSIAWIQAELNAYNYAFMHEEGLGKAEQKGEENKEKENVIKPYNKGKSAQEISEFLDIQIERVQQIISEFEGNKK